jgi:shikimate kinase
MWNVMFLADNCGSQSDFSFYDLDTLIATQQGILPTELGKFIESVGEFRFREIEFSTLDEHLKSSENFVLSLGGGALNDSILSYIKDNSQHIKLVFLNEEFEICYDRIKSDPNRLLSKLSESDLKKLYLKRLDLYSQADLIVLPSDRKLIDGLDRLVHTLSMI